MKTTITLLGCAAVLLAHHVHAASQSSIDGLTVIGGSVSCIDNECTVVCGGKSSKVPCRFAISPAWSTFPLTLRSSQFLLYIKVEGLMLASSIRRGHGNLQRAASEHQEHWQRRFLTDREQQWRRRWRQRQRQWRNWQRRCQSGIEQWERCHWLE